MNTYEHFREVSARALIPAAKYIVGAIRGEVDLSEYLIKGDKTAVTIVDRESQKITKSIILDGYPGIRLSQEESDEDSGGLGSKIKIHHDPLDGTGIFLVGGSGPAIVLDLYDSSRKKILAVATMEPSTGRFWFSSEEKGAWFNVYDYDEHNWLYDDQKIGVNKKEGLDGSRVLVDVFHPFKRKLKDGTRKQILTQSGRRSLSDQIEDAGGKEGCVNSSVQYALVATGRPTLVGCISTAIGGPWDVASMLHITEAEGAARCYGISKERELYKLESPEDIENADMVIGANSNENLKKLEDIVAIAVRE